MKKFNLDYWNKFYKKTKLTRKPTKFGKYCKKFIKNYQGQLYDVGCGNGRDVLYFNQNGINCIGIDKSLSAILILRKKFIHYKNIFKNADFCLFFKKQIKKKKFSIYSRFTLHAINYKRENFFFKNISKQKNLEYLFIETRTLKDNFYGVGKKVGNHEFISSHYRRFIDPEKLKIVLKKNFKIIYFKQAKNFAKFKGENPCVLRIVAKKK